MSIVWQWLYCILESGCGLAFVLDHLKIFVAVRGPRGIYYSSGNSGRILEYGPRAPQVRLGRSPFLQTRPWNANIANTHTHTAILYTRSSGCQWRWLFSGTEHFHAVSKKRYFKKVNIQIDSGDNGK